MINCERSEKYDEVKNLPMRDVFAIMFLSYFLSGIKDNQKNYQEERWRIYENTCFVYLEILEKVASDN